MKQREQRTNSKELLLCKIRGLFLVRETLRNACSGWWDPVLSPFFCDISTTEPVINPQRRFVINTRQLTNSLQCFSFLSCSYCMQLASGKRRAQASDGKLGEDHDQVPLFVCVCCILRRLQMAWNGDIRWRSDMHLTGGCTRSSSAPETHLQHLSDVGIFQLSLATTPRPCPAHPSRKPPNTRQSSKLFKDHRLRPPMPHSKSLEAKTMRSETGSFPEEMTMYRRFSHTWTGRPKPPMEHRNSVLDSTRLDASEEATK